MRDIIEEILESSSIETGNRLRARLEEIRSENIQRGEDKTSPLQVSDLRDILNELPGDAMVIYKKVTETGNLMDQGWQSIKVQYPTTSGEYQDTFLAFYNPTENVLCITYK